MNSPGPALSSAGPFSCAVASHFPSPLPWRVFLRTEGLHSGLSRDNSKQRNNRRVHEPRVELRHSALPALSAAGSARTFTRPRARSPSMNEHHLSPLDRLVALAAEAEKILSRGVASHDIRHACALARGYLELARQYDEPLNAADVERLVVRIRTALSEDQAALPATDASAAPTGTPP